MCSALKLARVYIAQIHCTMTLVSFKYNVNSKKGMTTNVCVHYITVMINTQC